MRGRDIFEPPRFMSCGKAANQLLQLTEDRLSGTSAGDVNNTSSSNYNKRCLSKDSLVIGLARVGSCDQSVVVSTLSAMAKGRSEDGGWNLDCVLGEPLHSLIIPSCLQPVEEEFLLASSHFTTAAESVRTTLPLVYLPNETQACTDFEKARCIIAMHNVYIKSLQ